MTKYTPGPWTMNKIGDFNAVVFIDEGSTIGGIYRGGEEDTLRPEDARLIAAAPELAEALLKLSNRGHEFDCGQWASGPRPENCTCAILAARAALQKAGLL